MPESQNEVQPRRHLTDGYLAVAAVCFLCFSHLHLLLIDDGFIAHRYAANLVHGYGLVFTRGERVEGISDLGWVLLMTIPQLLSWRPELFALALGAASGMAALVVAYRAAVVSLRISWKIALAAVCLAACNADFWIVAANGIESGLYALVVTSAFALVISPPGRAGRLWAGIALGLATTLRPESAALAPLALACLALADSKGRFDFPAWRRSLRSNWTLLIPWAAILIAVSVWRFSYYGQWIPNTIPAKSHPLHLRDLYFGAKYLFLFCLEAMPWVILPFALCLRKLDVTALLGAGWIGYQIVVVMLNGGDWMFGYRFLSVFFPVIVVLSVVGLDALLNRYRGYYFSIVMGVALAAVIALSVNQAIYKPWTWNQGILQRHALLEIVPPMYEPYYLHLAKVLKPALAAQDVIAPEVLGVVSYVLLDYPMHDWLGLVDSYIAHHGTVYFPTFGKADPVYSVEVVRPSVFAFASGARTLAIFESETKGTFTQLYDCWEVTGQPLILAIRRDREDALLSAIRRAHLPIRPFHVPGQ